PPAMYTERFLPNNVNIYESDALEVFTTEQTIYDTVAVAYTITNNTAVNAASAQHNFLSAAIPAHDSVTVRIKPNIDLSNQQRQKLVIKNTVGSRTFVQKAKWQNGWATAKFRQFGSYQVFIDDVPPTVNAPLLNLSKATRIVFVPKDNFNSIKKFRVELDGQWLRFSNDKGRTWIYNFDEKFTRGEHELKVIAEDEAGNVMERVWIVRR
ncbi:MAG: M23 family peptidase, partial [Bacteroidota bacterium]